MDTSLKPNCDPVPDPKPHPRLLCVISALTPESQSPALAGPRVMHAANMLLEAKRWIQATHPAAWKRRGGRDHVWLIPNDEGVSRRPV